jgi:hypothetical protein
MNVRCHVWRRKELESYLLETPAVARLTGASEEWVEHAFAEAAEESEDHVYAQITGRALQRSRHDKSTQAVSEGRAIFKEVWVNRASRKWVAPPENVLHGLNRRLAKDGYPPVSFSALERELAADEIASEMVNFLDSVEDALRAAGVSSFVDS